MVKKIGVLIVSALFLANLYGCVAVVAGTAGGAGTATWLSGKLVQNVDAPFEKSLQAAKEALKSLDLKITKETVEGNNAQLRSEYTDGKPIWVDVHRLTPKASSIEVRVGLLGDKEAAQKILDRIHANL
jgi:hypothetical protein